MTPSYLQQLSKAYADRLIERRTYILERRRLIDEAVAGVDSQPPHIPQPRQNLEETDATLELPRPLPDDEE